MTFITALLAYLPRYISRYYLRAGLRPFLAGTLKTIRQQTKVVPVRMPTPIEAAPAAPINITVQSPAAEKPFKPALDPQGEYWIAYYRMKEAELQKQKAEQERIKRYYEEMAPAPEIPAEIAAMPQVISASQYLASMGYMTQTPTDPFKPLPPPPPPPPPPEPESEFQYIGGKHPPARGCHYRGRRRSTLEMQEYRNPKISRKYTIGRREYLLGYETQKWAYQW